LRHDIHGEQSTFIGGYGGIFGQLHLYGNYLNVARFSIESGQYISLGPEWRFDVKAHAETRHGIFSIGQHALIAAPFVEVLWTTRDYREDAPQEGFRTWRAGMKVELPF
jgi:hypothetical protein